MSKFKRIFGASSAVIACLLTAVRGYNFATTYGYSIGNEVNGLFGMAVAILAVVGILHTLGVGSSSRE